LTEIGDFHVTNTNDFMGQVWLGFCVSVVFSSCA